MKYKCIYKKQTKSKHLEEKTRQSFHKCPFYSSRIRYSCGVDASLAVLLQSKTSPVDRKVKDDIIHLVKYQAQIIIIQVTELTSKKRTTKDVIPMTRTERSNSSSSLT